MPDLKHEVLAERWAVLINERMESGMTIKEWCHERQIKESQYYYWLRTLRCKEIEKAERRQGTSPFVELPAVLQGQGHRGAAIIRKGEISIEVPESAPADFIIKLLEATAHAW